MSGLIMLMLLIPASPGGSLGIGNILEPGDSPVPWEHLCTWRQPCFLGAPVYLETAWCLGPAWCMAASLAGLLVPCSAGTRPPAGLIRVLVWTALHAELPRGSLRS